MSKKLAGNGRWESSRMMLPEHREALLERRNAPTEIKRAEVPTKEELEMIRDSVLLPIMLTMVEKNGKELQLSTNTLRKLYLAATQILMNRLHAELARLRRELRERQIKVFEDDREDSDLHFRYICRGYEDKFSVIRDVARATISVKLGQHIQAIVGEMQK
ncbi:hypothetical protein [Paenibacillus xerothermodurans]|uniref:Uncharacterized protein n=1 Tax=Paenibacillus xerothermodurans TaxID=1977292 RepID=A0A2W1NVH9_PAEXE|nr:hypothetical protein [Paenibacillus xerothermodurans]PZE22593.1 hypothetical protein CBW46_002115 [Paenibacillus xerothermodurans]